MKKIIITQSNYIPWKGYFDAINQADSFVLYDEVQFTRRDWRNRNIIKTANGPHWLTIPVEVKGKYFQKIKDTKVSDPGWANKHWKTIYSNYGKAPFFGEVSDFLESLYRNTNTLFLSEINYHFLREICQWMNIKTEFYHSGDFELMEDRTERLVHICQQLGGKVYLSGPAAKDYLDEKMFREAGIDVTYLDYTGYQEYHQLYPPFDHGVSIVDLLFSTGGNFRNYMKSFKDSHEK